MKQKIIIARHGATHNNVDRLERGWGDLPLSAQGLQEAKDLAISLKGLGVYGIFTSDLKRAATTADEISKELDVPIIKKTVMLRTWDVGDIEGIEEKAARLVERQYVLNPDVKTPNGESFNSFKERILTEFRDLVSEYSGKKILLVVHHQVERLLYAWLKMGGNSDYATDMSTFFDKGTGPGKFDEVIVDVDKLSNLMHCLMQSK